jgi:branched-chain amino acid transport system ATP-binding protein
MTGAPRLLLLDEPTSGVAAEEKFPMMDTIMQALQGQALTVLFVEHDMDMVHDISDWVIVMAEGRIIAEGTPDDISSNTAVIDAYLGTRQGQSLLDRE